MEKDDEKDLIRQVPGIVEISPVHEYNVTYSYAKNKEFGRNEIIEEWRDEYGRLSHAFGPAYRRYILPAGDFDGVILEERHFIAGEEVEVRGQIHPRPTTPNLS